MNSVKETITLKGSIWFSEADEAVICDSFVQIYLREAYSNQTKCELEIRRAKKGRFWVMMQDGGYEWGTGPVHRGRMTLLLLDTLLRRIGGSDTIFRVNVYMREI